MATIKEQMASAKAYIQNEQYDDARRILRTIDHPTAQQWLAKLNDKHPPQRQRHKLVLFLLMCVVVGVSILVVGSQLVSQQVCQGSGIC